MSVVIITSVSGRGLMSYQYSAIPVISSIDFDRIPVELIFLFRGSLVACLIISHPIPSASEQRTSPRHTKTKRHLVAVYIIQPSDAQSSDVRPPDIHPRISNRTKTSPGFNPNHGQEKQQSQPKTTRRHRLRKRRAPPRGQTRDQRFP